MTLGQIVVVAVAAVVGGYGVSSCSFITATGKICESYNVRVVVQLHPINTTQVI